MGTTGKSRIVRQWNIGRITRHDMERAALGSSLMRVDGSYDSLKRVHTLRAQWTSDLENVYRVMLGDGAIEVVCMGIDSVDKEAEGDYKAISELPAWMQERLAVLQMMKVDPPQTKIEGVGMRIDERVFWVVKGG